MIKNVRVKVFLQNTVFSIFSAINKHITHNRNIIMLYSNSGLRDNIKALFDYMIQEKYNNKYTIICSVNDYKKYFTKNVNNVYFVSNIIGAIKYFFAGYVFYCFGKIPIVPGNQQEVIQMWHGSPFKMADKGMLEGHNWKLQYYTHVISAAQNFNKYWSFVFSIPEEKIIINGYPRCDLLFLPSPKYDFGKYDKLILWAPTFRRSHITGYSDVTDSSNNTIPIVRDNDFGLLNEYLKSLHVKLIVKLHPMQDINPDSMRNLDHLILLSNKEFVDKGMILYRLMKQADALITDYSSIFYDYLLLNRPIGFTEDDVKDYGNTRGYAVDDIDTYRPGERINTFEDLKCFIKHIVDNQDDYKVDRARVLKLSNDFTHGGFRKHLLDVLEIIK